MGRRKTDADSAYSSNSSTTASSRSSRFAALFKRTVNLSTTSPSIPPSTNQQDDTAPSTSYVPNFSPTREITIDWKPMSTSPIKKTADGNVKLRSAFDDLEDVDTNDNPIEHVLPAEPKAAYERRMQRRTAYTNHMINAPPCASSAPVPPTAKIDSVIHSTTQMQKQQLVVLDTRAKDRPAHPSSG